MFFRRATPESPHSHLLRFQFLETRKTPPKWPRVSMTVFGTIPPVLPCYGAPPRILTARCPPLSLPCFGRVSKRPRESALFAVPAESTRVFTPSPQDPPVPGGQRTSPPLVSRLAHHPRTPRAVASGATSGILKYILYNRNRHEACLDKTPSCAFITITALGRLVPLAFRHSLPVSGHFLFVVWSRSHHHSSICRRPMNSQIALPPWW